MCVCFDVSRHSSFYFFFFFHGMYTVYIQRRFPTSRTTHNGKLAKNESVRWRIIILSGNSSGPVLSSAVREKCRKSFFSLFFFFPSKNSDVKWAYTCIRLRAHYIEREYNIYIYATTRRTRTTVKIGQKQGKSVGARRRVKPL